MSTSQHNKIIVLSYNKQLQTFFKEYPHVKDKYISNVTDCFIQDTYNELSERYRKMTSFETYANRIVKNYFTSLQTKTEMEALIKSNDMYRCIVFGLHRDNLAFSCSLDIANTYVEIHDVCIGQEMKGKGLCKKYIETLVAYIQQTYIKKYIVIKCVTSNIPAYKCYLSIFGEPIKLSPKRDKDLYVFRILMKNSKSP